MTTLLYYDKTTGDIVAQLSISDSDHARFQQENANLGFLPLIINNLNEWRVDLATLQVVPHVNPQPLI